jgi:hypothetical protein
MSNYTNPLVKLVEKHGINNLHFKLKSPDRYQYRKEVEILAQITEERYPVSGNFKVTLTPFNSDYSAEHFYQSDFMQMLEDGTIIVQDPNGNPIDFPN